MTEVSLIPHLLCLTVDLKSYLQQRMYGLLLQQGKQLLSVYICLVGFYKCKSSGFRNPTSRPHIAMILTVVISMWLRPTIDNGYDSFFFLLKYDPNSNDGSQMGLCTSHSEGMGGQVSPLHLDKSTYRLYALLCSDPANAHQLGVVSMCRHLHVS